MILETKKLSHEQLEEIGLEFIEAILDGTMTEARYDQIIEIAAEDITVPDAFVGMIYQGKPAWREKHYKRYNITGLNSPRVLVARIF